MANKLTTTPADTRHAPVVETTAQNRTRRANPSEDKPSLTPRRVALGIFLLGFCVALLFTFIYFPRQGAIAAAIDVNGFGQLGRNIAAGDGFSLGWGPTLRRAPLYPALVSLILRVTGNHGPDNLVYRPVQFLQCLLFGLICLTAWAMTRKLFGNRTALVAGILCALTPQSLRYVPMTEVETLMTLLIALTALTGLNLARRPTLANGALFGLVAGLATLTKPIEELYPVLFCALVLWQWRSARRRASESSSQSDPLRSPIPALALSLVVLALTLTPWTLRNIRVSHGEFRGISSNAPGEFLRGYVLAQPKYVFLRENFGGWGPHGAQWDWEANQYEDAILRRHGMSFFSVQYGNKMRMEERVDLELKKDRIEGAEMRRRLMQESGGFIKKFTMQLFTYWYIVETKSKSLMVGLISLIALLLAVRGGVQARRNQILLFPVVAVVIYFNGVYAFFLAFARYSMPVFPVLLSLSAYGLVSLWPQRKTKDTSTANSGA